MTAINIKSCRECKDLSEDRDHTSDSWEYETKGICKVKNKYIFRFQETRDPVPEVPEWCPKRVHKRKNCADA